MKSLTSGMFTFAQHENFCLHKFFFFLQDDTKKHINGTLMQI